MTFFIYEFYRKILSLSMLKRASEWTAPALLQPNNLENRPLQVFKQHQPNPLMFLDIKITYLWYVFQGPINVFKSDLNEIIQKMRPLMRYTDAPCVSIHCQVFELSQATSGNLILLN